MSLEDKREGNVSQWTEILNLINLFGCKETWPEVRIYTDFWATVNDLPAGNLEGKAIVIIEC